MKRRKWFIALQRIALLVAVVLALAFAEKNVHSTPLLKSSVIIDRPGKHQFLRTEDLDAEISEFLGDTSVSSLSEINIAMLEEKLEELPGVSRAEVYFRLNGEVCANVVQRKPFVRVLDGERSGYWDESLNHFPAVKHYSANVPLIMGKPDSSQIERIIGFHQVMIADTFYTDFVSAYQWVGNELFVYPRYGIPEIVWGVPEERMSGKMKKLKKVYQSVYPAVGFDQYKSINLKFADQVVSTKREDHGGR